MAAEEPIPSQVCDVDDARAVVSQAEVRVCLNLHRLAALEQVQLANMAIGEGVEPDYACLQDEHVHVG